MMCVHYLSPTVYTHVGGTCSQVTRVCLIFFLQLVIWIVYLYKGLNASTYVAYAKVQVAISEDWVNDTQRIISF